MILWPPDNEGVSVFVSGIGLLSQVEARRQDFLQFCEYLDRRSTWSAAHAPGESPPYAGLQFVCPRGQFVLRNPRWNTMQGQGPQNGSGFDTDPLYV